MTSDHFDTIVALGTARPGATRELAHWRTWGTDPALVDTSTRRVVA